jgi:hypothetical protein
MKKSKYILTVLILVVSLLFAEEGKVNFSGEWSLNEDKSELGEGRGRFMSTKLVVKQEADKISIERTGQGRDGEFTRTEEITLDGKENELEGFGDTMRKVTAKWTDDGKTLTISSFMEFYRDGNPIEITIKEVWTLKEESTLSVASSMTSPRGERSSNPVYDKVE